MRNQRALSYSGLTDEKLMELYQGSDKEAFDVLFKRHSGLVYGYLLKKLHDEELAKDILQMVFMKLHAHKEKFDTAQPFLPWFFVLVRNTMTDELRKKKETLEFKEEMYASETTPASSIDLESAIQSLNPRYQKVLEMRYVDDLDFDKIAKELNTTSQNIRKIVSRAIQDLKDKFSEGKK